MQLLTDQSLCSKVTDGLGFSAPARKLNANLCQSSVHKGSFKESTGIQMERPAAVLVYCYSLSSILFFLNNPFFKVSI